jgi:putative FmdB family regulatory protein
MPFYEYECSSCGFRDEVLQAINDKPLKKCPNCGKSSLRKLMSAPVFRLKGSGWYETDFKGDKENKRNLAGADKDEPKAESKTDAKTDTKADAKPETKADAPKVEPAKPEASKSQAKPAARKAAPRAKAKPTPKSKSARKRR